VITDQWVSVAEVAAEFDVSEAVVLGWIRRGELSTVKMGPVVRLWQDEVERFSPPEELRWARPPGWLGPRELPAAPALDNVTRNGDSAATCVVKPAFDAAHIRAARAGTTVGTLPARLEGYFATWTKPSGETNWYEINNRAEGRFLESVAKGSLARSFERPSAIKVLLEHGHDHIGNRPLGVTESLREDDYGARYAARLFDVDYVRSLVPALAAGQYSSSWRFSVQDESYDPKPARTAFNPTGLPQRVIRDASVKEYGPCLFGASPTATAGLVTPKASAPRSSSERRPANRNPRYTSSGVYASQTRPRGHLY
jgi:phage head maturation protease